MTQAANITPSATTSNVSPSGVAPAEARSLEERANDAFGSSDPASEAGSTAAPSALNDTASGAGSGDPAAQAREARRAEIQALKNKERSSVDAKAALQQRDELLRKTQELEAQLNNRFDPSKLDEVAFFNLAKQAKVTPQKLAEWMRAQVESPELLALRGHVDPRITALEAQNAALLQKVEGFLDGQTKQQRASQEAQLQNQFTSYVTQNAATSPLAARFVERHGAEQFLRLAEGAANDLPHGAGPQALLDEIEHQLSELGQIYTAPAANQRTQANQPRMNPAAAQAPTHVTNQLASQRSSVVDEDAEFDGLSLEEKAAILFR